MKMEQLHLKGIDVKETSTDVFDNEFLLQDRIQKIQQIVNKYGEENFYISFSGGKDSTVLHYLIDMALPGNQIPRVYANTGIELNMVRDFVLDMKENDARIQIIKPKTPIKQMLEAEGYPFKSKAHAQTVEHYQKRNEMTRWVSRYLRLELNENDKKFPPRFSCPDILRYQFSDSFDLKISDKCCKRLKEDPLKEWQKENNKPYGILGLMREEGGRRERAVCLAFKGDELKNFQPLVAITKEWEEWFIEEYNIKICDIYYPPYSLKRTGCKGCPFAPDLQNQLDMFEQFFPNERKQCEIIWGPVYKEYRRIGYRLKDSETGQIEGQLSLFGEDQSV